MYKRLLGSALFILGAWAVHPAENTALARQDQAALLVLSDIQMSSINQEREICGYLLAGNNGNFKRTQYVTGTLDGCYMDFGRASKGGQVIASFHTHANYDPEYENEIPSVDDVVSDMNEGLYGYVSTPGGRVWRISPYDGYMVMICDLECIPQDPNFDINDSSVHVPSTLTLEMLEARFED